MFWRLTILRFVLLVILLLSFFRLLEVRRDEDRDYGEAKKTTGTRAPISEGEGKEPKLRGGTEAGRDVGQEQPPELREARGVERSDENPERGHREWGVGSGEWRQRSGGRGHLRGTHEHRRREWAAPGRGGEGTGAREPQRARDEGCVEL